MKATEPGPVFLFVEYNNHTYNFITNEDFGVWRTMSLDVGETQGHQLVTFTYINDTATLIGDTYVDDRNVYVKNIRSVKKT